jgi:hypothetical protein
MSNRGHRGNGQQKRSKPFDNPVDLRRGLPCRLRRLEAYLLATLLADSIFSVAEHPDYGDKRGGGHRDKLEFHSAIPFLA